jgi:hypothetical protein
MGVAGCASTPSDRHESPFEAAADSADMSDKAPSATAMASGSPASNPVVVNPPNTDSAATPDRFDVLGNVPDDFTIDLTILPGVDARKHSEAHLAQGKYILFPDGSLHGDRGRGLGFLTRPARARTLSREAMSDLWLLLQQTGFDARETPSDSNVGEGLGTESIAVATAQTATQGAFSGNPALLAPGPTEVLTILSVRSGGNATTYLRRTSAELPDPALTRVVRAIAGLAWASDVSSDGTDIQPIRYDFGPDPYLRYRQVTTIPSLPKREADPTPVAR